MGSGLVEGGWRRENDVCFPEGFIGLASET